MRSLLVCGTSSDAGKSVVVAGLCRYLRDQGVDVAPFKAQNMSLNSAVTARGEEIGRAQAFQAFAAGLEPEAEMNPILIKPTTDTSAQVVVMGRPELTTDAASYGSLHSRLSQVAKTAFDSLQSRHDVIICEGAGSLAEFNLRDRDLVNLGFARQANVPVVVVADIDRGGSFASLYGSLALLTAADQALVCGFILNKFRGDSGLLSEGLARFTALTGRKFFGVLPWIRGIVLDAEDALDLKAAVEPASHSTDRPLHVAVIRLRAMSNFTDFDPLRLEPNVVVRFTQSATEVVDADLVVIPGSKSTVADLHLLRAKSLDAAICRRVEVGKPTLGICAGYQMLGQSITDDVESGAGEVHGLGLLPVATRFERDKIVAQRRGRSIPFDAECNGYEIRHGRQTVSGGSPMFRTEDGNEGCKQGALCGTSWHGVFESDSFRRAVLSWVAVSNHIDWHPAETSFPAAREAQAALLGRLISEHADTKRLLELMDEGPPPGLQVIDPAGVS